MKGFGTYETTVAGSVAQGGGRNVEPRFVIEPFEPIFRRLDVSEISRRAELAVAQLERCHVCPRSCGVNRYRNEVGTCSAARHARVVSAFPHSGEEDCLRGRRGSGTIFFGGCTLQCVFCQNWDISQRPAGEECAPESIARVMIALQEHGCHNINFVTPEHVVPQVLEAVAAAVPRGLNLPIVYNTSGFDSVDTLRLLDGIVDIYMPDFKFWRRETANRLTRSTDYPDRARDAIREMHRQVGVLKFSPEGIARRGLLVRHLVMPGQVEESAAIFGWLASELSPDTFVNIMGQYHPEHQVGRIRRPGAAEHEDINRRPTRAEIVAAYAAASEAGLWRFDEAPPDQRL